MTALQVRGYILEMKSHPLEYFVIIYCKKTHKKRIEYLLYCVYLLLVFSHENIYIYIYIYICRVTNCSPHPDGNRKMGPISPIQ